MKIQQISLFAENKPGHISAPARLLAQQGIDIRALYLADTQQYGIVRMIVTDWQKAAALFEAHGFVVKVTEVLAVEVPDRPGGLADVLGALDGTGINIEYMYAFPYVRGNEAILIFRFADPDVAIERLQAAGINLLASEELLKK
ncbi:MAG: ACT domain-containing protein [Terracidiphilus sp.]|nr:ACT domain-containing protein [Terracidiphilus sp.]